MLFHEANCQCYYPLSFTTAANAAEPELASQDIRPYTNLLLHDTGEGLADNRPEFQASGREWRTPPLWGGLTETVSGHTRFLHDGRARSILVAILRHGGKAEGARKAVSAPPCSPLSIPGSAETVQRLSKAICSISFSSEPKDRTEYVTSGELVNEREDCMATPVYPQHLAEKFMLQCVAGESHWV